MRKLLLILAVIVLLVAAAWLAAVLMRDAGYVMVEVAGWRVEASVLVLIAAVIAAWLVLWLLAKFIRAPARARAAWQRRQLEQGLLALAEGDWARAERALKHASPARRSTAGLLAAARAAQGQARLEHRDHYLDQARRPMGRRRFIAELARARLLLAEGDAAAAAGLLERLHLKKKRHVGVLRLLLQAYQESGRWHDVRLLAPALRRAGVIDGTRARSLVALAATRELETAADPGELEAMWSRLGRVTRADAGVTAAYAGQAADLGQPELGEPVLRRVLKRDFRPELLAVYARAADSDRGQRIVQCERWLDARPDHPQLLLASGELYAQDRQFEKAAERLEKSVRIAPSAHGFEALGRIMDRDGRTEAAAQCYRNALRLNQGRPAEPLPPPL